MDSVRCPLLLLISSISREDRHELSLIDMPINYRIYREWPIGGDIMPNYNGHEAKYSQASH